jgi:two-component sensor histidine kinase
MLTSLLIVSVAAWSSAFAIEPPALDKQIVIPDGTEISAVTTDTLSSKTAHEDDAITFKVDEDVVIDGSIVIAKGTIIKGVVTNAKKSGFFGKGGQLNIRVESTVAVDGQKIKVRASKGKEGNDKTGTTVALVVLFGPLGFLKKGKNAEIKEGTKIKVFTDEEKKVTVSKP